MVPIGYAVSNDTGEQAHCVANALPVHAAHVMSFRTDTRCTRSPRCPSVSAVTSSLASIFSPAGFPSPETTWPVTTAFDDGASPSNGGPHHPPRRPHADCAGGIPQGAVRLEPLGRTPIVASRAQRWTGNHPPAPSAGGLDRGSASPPPSPRGLAAACACATPRVV